MGNTVPPRMCREAVIGRRHPKGVQAVEGPPPAAPRRVAVVAARKQRQDNVEEVTRAGRRRGGSEAATVVTVKIVLKRKDAEELVARLNAQSARERKARMSEIKCELRAAEDGGGASPAPAACRDAWRPSLAPIQEN